MTVDEYRQTLNDEQRLYLLNALNLYREAYFCVWANYAKGGGNDLSKERFSAAAAVYAGIYLANLRWLAEMLGSGHPFRDATSPRVVGFWKRAYEWMIKNGLRRPISYDDGTGRMATLGFDEIHRIVMSSVGRCQQD